MALNGFHTTTDQCSKGGRAEKVSSGGGRDKGEHGEGLPGLWQTPKIDNVLQIPGSENDGIGWWLDGGGGEPAEGEENMGAFVKNLGKGRGEAKGVGDVFQRNGAAGTYFWVGEVGDETPHGPCPGGGFNIG